MHRISRSLRRRLFYRLVEQLEPRYLLTFDLAAAIDNPGSLPQANAMLSSVAMDNSLAAIGSPSADVNGLRDAGAVAVFGGETGDLRYELFSPAPIQDENFGSSLAIGDTVLVVGTETPEERAHVFHPQTGVFRHTLYLPDPAPAGQPARFGDSIATSAGRVAVGAPQSSQAAFQDGAVYLFDADTDQLQRTIVNPAPNRSDDFGTAVSLLDDRLLVGARWDDAGAVDAGSAYLFDASTGELLRTFPNPSPSENAQFGWSVAQTSQYIIVGARQDDTSAQSAGRVYVYDAFSFEPVTELENPSPSVSDEFGFSLSATEAHLVVGTVRADLGAIDSGATYVFDLSTLELLDTIGNPTPDNSDNFGWSVALSSDRVLVASRRDDTVTDNTGSGSLFRLSDRQLVTQLQLPLPNTDEIFGSSVALSPDGEVLVAGAPGDDFGAPDSGTAYVVNASTGQVLHSLQNPAPASDDQFGASVAIGESFVVIGAPMDAAASVRPAGRVFVYDRSSGELLHSISSPSPERFDRFGAAVAVWGNRIAVGSPLADLGEPQSTISNAGRVDIFDIQSGQLLDQFENPSAGADDNFGSSVALWSDQLVVGSDQDSDALHRAGMAFQIDLASRSIKPIAPPNPRTGGGFGTSVSVTSQHVAISAPTSLAGTILIGTVDLFSTESGEHQATAFNPEGAPNAFGNSISLFGNQLLVGAPGQDAGATNAGSVYHFDTSGVLQQTIRNPSPGQFDSFGNSVALVGNRLAVGTPRRHGATFERGAVYVFDDDQQQPGPNRTPTANDDFAVTGESQRILVDVIQNDTDPDLANLLSLVDASTSIRLATLDSTQTSIELRTATLRQNSHEIVFDPGDDFFFLREGETATVAIDYEVTDDGQPPLQAAGVLTLRIEGQDDAPVLEGDFNFDGVVDVFDIDLLFAELRRDTHAPLFDLTGDTLVNEADRDRLILEILDTTYGDANLDGVFDSSDLLLVFQAGQFQDNLARNSRWATGDWDGDGEFGTSDIVLAFQLGGYQP